MGHLVKQPCGASNRYEHPDAVHAPRREVPLIDPIRDIINDANLRLALQLPARVGSEVYNIGQGTRSGRRLRETVLNPDRRAEHALAYQERA